MRLVEHKTAESNSTRLPGETTKISDPNSKMNALKTQYERLASYWMHFNTIIWAVPTIAITIMTGILIGSYRMELDGLPRIVSLSIGSLFLFSLTIEVVKKRYHMNAISYLLKDLQAELGLEAKLQFPLGVGKDLHEFLESKFTYENESPDRNDPVFNFFRRSYARQFLTWVILCAAIGLAVLAEWEFVTYYREEWSILVAILIGIAAVIAPMAYYAYRIRKEKKNKQANLLQKIVRKFKGDGCPKLVEHTGQELKIKVGVEAEGFNFNIGQFSKMRKLVDVPKIAIDLDDDQYLLCDTISKIKDTELKDKCIRIRLMIIVAVNQLRVILSSIKEEPSEELKKQLSKWIRYMGELHKHCIAILDPTQHEISKGSMPLDEILKYQGLDEDQINDAIKQYNE